MPRVIASVKALIVRGDEFLLVKAVDHKNKYWELPGGKIEYGENPYNTLKREVDEELSIEVSIVKPAGIWWFISKNCKHHVICTTFVCSIDTNADIDITTNPADENIVEFNWVKKDELNEYEEYMEPSLIELIRKTDLKIN